MAIGGGERGQASVELVGVLPLLAVLCALLWQAVVAGQAVWLSGSAARAAARAAAVGGDPARAARDALPGRLERGLRVAADGAGGVHVVLGVPAVLTGGTLTTITAHGAFPGQS